MATKKEAHDSDEIEYIITVSCKAVDAVDALDRMKEGEAKVLGVNPRPIPVVPAQPPPPGQTPQAARMAAFPQSPGALAKREARQSASRSH